MSQAQKSAWEGPFKGVHQGAAYADQPELTAFDALNVRNHDPYDDRLKIAKRSGVSRFITNAVERLHEPVQNINGILLDVNPVDPGDWNTPGSIDRPTTDPDPGSGSGGETSTPASGGSTSVQPASSSQPATSSAGPGGSTSLGSGSSGDSNNSSSSGVCNTDCESLCDEYTFTFNSSNLSPALQTIVLRKNTVDEDGETLASCIWNGSAYTPGFEGGCWRVFTLRCSTSGWIIEQASFGGLCADINMGTNTWRPIIGAYDAAPPVSPNDGWISDNTVSGPEHNGDLECTNFGTSSSSAADSNNSSSSSMDDPTDCTDCCPIGYNFQLYGVGLLRLYQIVECEHVGTLSVLIPPGSAIRAFLKSVNGYWRILVYYNDGATGAYFLLATLQPPFAYDNRSTLGCPYEGQWISQFRLGVDESSSSGLDSSSSSSNFGWQFAGELNCPGGGGNPGGQPSSSSSSSSLSSSSLSSSSLSSSSLSSSSSHACPTGTDCDSWAASVTLTITNTIAELVSCGALCAGGTPSITLNTADHAGSRVLTRTGCDYAGTLGDGLCGDGSDCIDIALNCVGSTWKLTLTDVSGPFTFTLAGISNVGVAPSGGGTFVSKAGNWTVS